MLNGELKFAPDLDRGAAGMTRKGPDMIGSNTRGPTAMIGRTTVSLDRDEMVNRACNVVRRVCGGVGMEFLVRMSWGR
jgi:hypothetical protein